MTEGYVKPRLFSTHDIQVNPKNGYVRRNVGPRKRFLRVSHNIFDALFFISVNLIFSKAKL